MFPNKPLLQSVASRHFVVQHHYKVIIICTPAEQNKKCAHFGDMERYTPVLPAQKERAHMLTQRMMNSRF